MPSSSTSPSITPTSPAPPAPSPFLGPVLVLLVFASRLPFLLPGFGNDTDTWKLARAAREIGTTGEYAASRLPGFPVEEWVSALFWKGGPLWANGLTAAVSALCTLAVYRLLRRVAPRDAWLAALAFAFVPAVYIASVSSIDYLWALLFVLLGIDAALSGHGARAGLWLGLATGGRITSCLFFAPAAVLLWARAGRTRVAAIASAAGVATVVGLACYAPVYRRYGFSFLSYYEPSGPTRGVGDFVGGIVHPGHLPFPLSLVLGQATVLLWGAIGMGALALVIAAAVLWRRPRAEANAPAPGVVGAAVLALALITVLYIRLPHDEGYLIPALPFALVLLGLWLPRPLHRAFLVALLVSPFLIGVDVEPPKKGLSPLHRSPGVLRLTQGGQTVIVEPFRGPLLQDHDKRVRAMAVHDSAVVLMHAQREPYFVLAGTLSHYFEYSLPHDWWRRVYADVVPEAEVRRRIAAGEHVYYLPDLPDRVRRIAHYDLLATGARPLLATPGSAKP